MLPAHDRLASFLRRERITTINAAAKLGCSRTTLSLILNGHHCPSLAVAAQIERITYGLVRCVDWVPAEEAHAAA